MTRCSGEWDKEPTPPNRLDNCQRKNGYIYDSHYDELIHPETGEVLCQAYDNFEVSVLITDRPYSYYKTKSDDAVDYGDYVEQW